VGLALFSRLISLVKIISSIVILIVFMLLSLKIILWACERVYSFIWFYKALSKTYSAILLKPVTTNEINIHFSWRAIWLSCVIISSLVVQQV